MDKNIKSNQNFLIINIWRVRDVYSEINEKLIDYTFEMNYYC